MSRLETRNTTCGLASMQARHAAPRSRLVLALMSLAVSWWGCRIFGADLPCTADTDCPDAQVCSDDKTCRTGEALRPSGDPTSAPTDAGIEGNAAIADEDDLGAGEGSD